MNVTRKVNNVHHLATKMKSITKEVRASINEGPSRPIVAIFYDEKGHEYKRTRYAYIDTAIPKVSCHVLWMPVMCRIELSHNETGFQIGVIKKNAKGEIKSHFCWEEAPKSVKGLLREQH